MKLSIRAACVFAVVVAANSCGESDTSSSSSEPATTTSPTEAPPITDPRPLDEVVAPPSSIELADAEVSCTGESVSTSFDYIEGQPVSATIEEAVDGWTFEGGAPYLRAELVSVADAEIGRAALIDGDGNLRILLTVRENENGWLVESSQRCLEP